MRRCRPASSLVLLLTASLTLSRAVKALQVIGGNVTVLQGENAILPCYLTASTESLTQISWQRKTKEKPVNDNFFTILPNESNFVNGDNDRFKFIGNFNAHNGSLLLSEVTLLDEGVYLCIFTLFPSGNHKTEIHLNVLVPPDIIITDSLPVLGNKEVSLATCTAARSRPRAEVKWITGTLGNKVKVTTNFTQDANGMTTTVSTLFGVPTKEIHQHSVSCVVTSPALTKEKTFKLQVYFSPTAVSISERSQNTFECLTEANPSANFSWSRPGQSVPLSAVRVEGATLHLLSITSELNGLYQCDASNQYGRKHVQLYVYVTSGTCTACWVLFGILLLLLVGLAAGLYFYRSNKDLRREAVPTLPVEPLNDESV